MEGLFAAQVRVQLLRQLIGLARHGRFVRALHPPNRNARRLVLLLRAHDALVDGADQREIASVLLGGRAAVPRWRVDNPSLRSRAQRLVRGARAFAAGGWRGLLR